MNQEILVGPLPSEYIKSSLQIWFSYLPGYKSFNFGNFGVNEASIAGVLHLRSTIIQPLIINSVKVKFIGEETKGWAVPETDDYESKGNFEETCNINSDIWESQEFKKVTSWDLPFNIPLPKNLPPSMSYGDNKIQFVRYRLMALVGEVTAEKIISVKINLTKYHLRPIINPPLMMSGDRPRCIEYDIRLNKTTYDHGETVKILMNLFLLNRRVKFKEIEICLKEYIVYGLSIKKDKKRRLVTKNISGEDIHNSLDGLEWITDISLKIPSCCQDDDESLLCDIDINGKKPMKVLHKIKIKIRTNKGIFGNISVEKRINIKNYVTKKTNTTNSVSIQEISEKSSSPINKPTATRSVSFNEPDRFEDLPPPPSYNASSLPLTPRSLPKISKPPPYVEPSRISFRKNINTVSPSSSSYLSKIEKKMNNLLLFKTVNSETKPVS